MRSVAWVYRHGSLLMGQQIHEQELGVAIGELSPPEWEVSAWPVGAWADGDAPHRLPDRLTRALPARLATAIGFLTYPRADVVHRFDLRLPPARRPEVLTVHDLPPLRFPDEGILPRHAVSSARRAAAVICPSGFAAEEVTSALAVQDIHVIPNGVSDQFRNTAPATPDELQRLGIHARYVLHAGGTTERKNLVELGKAWAIVSSTIPDAVLVTLGGIDERRRAAFSRLDRVVMPGYVDHAQVPALFRSAAAVVVPSTYEGFGLPALEAMASGVPVVAAARGALPEVCGAAALLVEPTSQGLADGLVAVLTDEALASGLRHAGRERAAPYTWQRTARETIDVYRRILG